MSTGPREEPAVEPCWRDLLATALVGTDRRAGTLPPGAPALAETLAELGQRDPEPRLLAAVAAVGVYRRAGRVAAPTR